jgi:arylsulfatase A-like enzyme
MSRCTFRLPTSVVAWLSCLVVTASVLLAREPARPNIIFILADDLGYGDLGCYGSPHLSTPHIDRLAVEGTRFTQAYSGSPVCAPSRGVLMTGLHTGHGRIRENMPRVGGVPESFTEGREKAMRLSLTSSDHTVAQSLQSAGYVTGMTGKWGLGEEGSDGIPAKKGFDEFLGYLNQNHAAYYYTDFLDVIDGRRSIPGNAGGRTAVYSNDLFAEFALDFVRRHRDRPFFLYLPFTIPHNRMEVPDLGAFADKPWPQDAKIYAAMVSRLDGYVGQLMAELRRLELDENTIIFFTSDNGVIRGERARVLQSAGPLRGFKATVYEGGIRVPMIVRWPGRVPAGRTCAEPWMFMDFFPTVMDLLGAPAPAGLDGISVLPLLTARFESLGERALYWEFPQQRLHQAIRVGRWKGVRFGIDQPLELYDLREDESESRNVAELHPQIVADFEQRLSKARISTPHWPAN